MATTAYQVAKKIAARVKALTGEDATILNQKQTRERDGAYAGKAKASVIYEGHVSLGDDRVTNLAELTLYEDFRTDEFWTEPAATWRINVYAVSA